ncbi:MAG TPA: Pycsar system effector family protein [Terriglobales bacterium]|nr:Pycsar system effector family protein [Terriglobales bacterium]
MKHPTRGTSTQSDGGTGWPVPAPPEVQKPLVAQTSPNAADMASTTDKVTVAPPEPAPESSYAWFSDDAHEYVREQIRNADQKATFFVAALTAILAFLNTQNVPTRWLKDPRLWSLVDALGFVSMLGLAAGAIILLAVVFPRLKGSRRGLLFFNAISEYDNSVEYANGVFARSHDDLVRTKLEHCYELSKICSAKYRMLRVGFWIGSVGSAAALLFLLFAKSSP